MSGGGRLNLYTDEFERRVAKPLAAFPGGVGHIIQSVLRDDVPKIAMPAIKNLMPVSGKDWKGKKPAAKTSNSLRASEIFHLSITIRTQKNYQYLYFPDDGTNTTRHVGAQWFFHRGGVSVQDEIINRCVKEITDAWDDKVGYVP